MDQVRQRLGDTDGPRTHVGNLNAVSFLLGVGLDPHGLLAPLARLRPLPPFNRKAHERDSESVYGLFPAFRPFAERLVKHIVVCAAQASANNLFREKRRTEGAQTQNVCHALDVPTFGEHVDADDAADVLARFSGRSDSIHHLPQDGLVALVRVEDLGIDLDSDPALAVVVIGIAKELVLACQMLKEPCRTLGVVGYAQEDRAGIGTHCFESAGPFVVILLPGRVDARDRALTGTQVLLLGLCALDHVPQVQIDASVLVRVGKTDNLDQTGLEGVVDRKVRHQPLEERSLRFRRSRSVPGRRREVYHQTRAGRL